MATSPDFGVSCLTGYKVLLQGAPGDGQRPPSADPLLGRCAAPQHPRHVCASRRLQRSLAAHEGRHHSIELSNNKQQRSAKIWRGPTAHAEAAASAPIMIHPTPWGHQPIIGRAIPRAHTYSSPACNTHGPRNGMCVCVIGCVCLYATAQLCMTTANGVSAAAAAIKGSQGW